VNAKKPDPAAIYLALDSFACALPGFPHFAVAKGARFRGSHPVVLKHPHLFAEDGLSDDEMAAQYRKYLDGAA